MEEFLIGLLMANPAFAAGMAILGTVVTVGTAVIGATSSKKDDAKLKDAKEKYGKAIDFVERFSILRRKKG